MLARAAAVALQIILPPLPLPPLPPLPPVPPPPACLTPPLPPICLPPLPIPPGDDPPAMHGELELRRDGDRVVLRWKAATDDRGIWGYRIYRDGDFVARKPAGARAATLRLPCGAHRYRLEAVDTSQQTGSRSARIVRRCQ